MGYGNTLLEDLAAGAMLAAQPPFSDEEWQSLRRQAVFAIGNRGGASAGPLLAELARALPSPAVHAMVNSAPESLRALREHVLLAEPEHPALREILERGKESVARERRGGDPAPAVETAPAGHVSLLADFTAGPEGEVALVLANRRARALDLRGEPPFLVLETQVDGAWVRAWPRYVRSSTNRAPARVSLAAGAGRAFRGWIASPGVDAPVRFVLHGLGAPVVSNVGTGRVSRGGVAAARDDVLRVRLADFETARAAAMAKPDPSNPSEMERNDAFLRLAAFGSAGCDTLAQVVAQGKPDDAFGQRSALESAVRQVLGGAGADGAALSACAARLVQAPEAWPGLREAVLQSVDGAALLALAEAAGTPPTDALIELVDRARRVGRLDTGTRALFERLSQDPATGAGTRDWLTRLLRESPK